MRKQAPYRGRYGGGNIKAPSDYFAEGRRQVRQMIGGGLGNGKRFSASVRRRRTATSGPKVDRF